MMTNGSLTQGDKQQSLSREGNHTEHSVLVGLQCPIRHILLFWELNNNCIYLVTVLMDANGMCDLDFGEGLLSLTMINICF